MTRTYVKHSKPTPTSGSVPHAGSVAPGAPNLDRHPAAPPRRAVLAGGAAALTMAAWPATATSAFPASPDANLIALCAGLDALQRRLDALFLTNWRGMTDPELEAADAKAYGIDGEQRVLLDQVCGLTPATPSGWAALARSMVLLRPDLLGAGPNTDPDVRLAAVLVRGLAGRA